MPENPDALPVDLVEDDTVRDPQNVTEFAATEDEDPQAHMGEVIG